MEYHAEPAFSYSGSRVKHRASSDLVTRTIDKIYEKKLRFYVKYCSRGKVQYLVLSNFLLVLKIFWFWEEDCKLHFNSWSSKIFFSLTSLGNLSVNSYLPFLLVITTFRFTCFDRNIWQDIFKFQNIMSTVVSFRNGTHGPWYV